MKIQTRKEIRLGKGHLISELKELDEEEFIAVKELNDLLSYLESNHLIGSDTVDRIQEGISR